MGRARSRLILIGAALVLGAGAAASCADPPVVEITKTRLAVTNLRDISHAEIWAPEELAAAEEAMQAAEQELSLQRGRFGIMREYSKAIDLLALAVADAEAARAAAESRKRAAESEAREALDAAISAIDHAWAALLIATVPRDRRSASGRLDTDLSRAERSLEEVRNLIVAEDYRAAAARAEEILDDVTRLVRRVSGGRS